MTTHQLPQPHEAARILAAWATAGLDTDGWNDLLRNTIGADALADGEYLWLLAEAIADQRKGLARLENTINEHRARDVTTHGPVRFADTFITYTPDNQRKILDKDALLEWLDQASEELGVPNLATQVFRISDDNLRIQTLRHVAERLYHHREEADDSEEGAADFVQLIEDTFLTIKKGAPKLKEIPIDKAPKYAQKLDHGHRAGSFANKPKEEET